MNKQRREDLCDVIDLLQEAYDRLDEIKEEEQDAFDNMPEGLQYSSRGDAMQDAIDRMEELQGDIEEVMDNIEKFRKGK